MELYNSVPLVLVSIFAVWREYVNYKFINALMDRLMSKTLFEFKQTTGALPQRLTVKKVPAITDEELYDREQKKLALIGE
jgi:hypothetical protein